MGTLTLITGGARSGKSRFAQELARKSDDCVLFVATAEALDDEMRVRIENHRQSRPPDWRTLEAPIDSGEHIRRTYNNEPVVIVDCITLLVNNIFSQNCLDGKINVKLIEKSMDAEIASLRENISKIPAVFILVTNEVGLGIVPDNEIARVYRDLLGKVNRELAEFAEEVYLMVAGIPIKIKPVRQ